MVFDKQRVVVLMGETFNLPVKSTCSGRPLSTLVGTSVGSDDGGTVTEGARLGAEVGDAIKFRST